jgi:hypothetical protein
VRDGLVTDEAIDHRKLRVNPQKSVPRAIYVQSWALWVGALRRTNAFFVKFIAARSRSVGCKL